MKVQKLVHQILQAIDDRMKSNFLFQMEEKIILMMVRVMIMMMVAVKSHKMARQMLQVTDKGMDNHFFILKMKEMKDLIKVH